MYLELHPGYLAGMFFLDEYPVVVTIVFPELFGCAPLFLPEQAIEVGDIIEPAIVSYFCYRLGCIYQQSRCMAQPHFQQAIHKSDTGPVFKKTAEGNVCHIRQPGYFRQRDRFLKIQVHVFDRSFYPPAVVRQFSITETCIRQCMHITGDGKIMQDG